MNWQAWPWVELSVLIPLIGAGLVSLARRRSVAFRLCLAFTSAAFLCSLLASGAFYATGPTPSSWLSLSGRPIFQLDTLSAPLLPLVALLHFVTALATARTKMGRVAFGWLLANEALRLGTFATLVPWVLIGLLSLSMIPPWLELRWRRKPTRVYALHATLFVVLLVGGWALVDPADLGPGAQPGTRTAWATVPLMLAILLRSGTVPAHCWIVDLFEHASFITGLLVVTPITGVYAALRLLLPIAPDVVLQGIGLASLVTAVYAAGMAVVQREARRFFAYSFVSHASLVLVGLELHTPISLTGALCLWISVALSLAGLGLTLRALEARFGRMSLADYHGLYEHAPTLAACFLLMGLASVGFPGTLGFISAELLVDGAIEANPFVGLAVILAGALNGIAVVRVYLLLFTGRRYRSDFSIWLTTRESLAFLILIALVLIGGLFPQPGVASRYQAARDLLQTRTPGPPAEPDGESL